MIFIMLSVIMLSVIMLSVLSVTIWSTFYFILIVVFNIILLFAAVGTLVLSVSLAGLR